MFSFTLNGFATVANILVLLRSISILGILGLGMGMIVISRGIDLSEVAIMAGAWSIALIEIGQGVPIFWAVIIALALAITIGVFNGLMVSPLSAGAPALFVTPSPPPSSSMAPAFWFAPAWVTYAPKDAPGLLWLGNGQLFGVPVPIFVFAACALVMGLFLSQTSVGRFIYAQGDNPEACSGYPYCVALRPLIVLEYVIVAPARLGRRLGLDRHHRLACRWRSRPVPRR